MSEIQPRVSVGVAAADSTCRWLSEINEKFPKPDEASSVFWHYCGAFRLIYHYCTPGLYEEVCEDLAELSSEKFAKTTTDLFLVQTTASWFLNAVVQFAETNGYKNVRSLHSLRAQANEVGGAQLSQVLLSLKDAQDAVQDVLDDQEIFVLEDKMRHTGPGFTSALGAKHGRIGAVLRGTHLCLKYAQGGFYTPYAVSLARIHYNDLSQHPVAFAKKMLAAARKHEQA